MNNDLSKLSDGELREKDLTCSEAKKFIRDKSGEAIDEYNRLLEKTFVRPTKLMSAKILVENYTKTLNMLREYSNTLADEYNKRI